MIIEALAALNFATAEAIIAFSVGMTLGACGLHWLRGLHPADHRAWVMTVLPDGAVLHDYYVNGDFAGVVCREKGGAWACRVFGGPTKDVESLADGMALVEGGQ